MNPQIQRAELPPHAAEDLPVNESNVEDSPLDLGFDQIQWTDARAEREAHGAGGRAVLGSGLIGLAILWLGFTAWSAGRVLAGQPLSSPAVAQWLAIAAGPPALLGLAWLIFGRTRRREAERFTRSVVAMRSEAHSLEALLAVLSQRIEDSKASLTGMTERLMQLGDETTGRLDGITRGLDLSSDRLGRNGQALDRAAELARTDIAVLLEDLPRAEATARAIAEQLRGVGSESASRTAELGQQVGALADRTREADELVGE